MIFKILYECKDSEFESIDSILLTHPVSKILGFKSGKKMQKLGKFLKSNSSLTQAILFCGCSRKKEMEKQNFILG